MDTRTHAAVTWLLNCGEPAIRLMTRRDVLGEQADEDACQVLAGAKVTALLSGQHGDGGFGVHPRDEDCVAFVIEVADGNQPRMTGTVFSVEPREPTG